MVDDTGVPIEKQTDPVGVANAYETWSWFWMRAIGEFYFGGGCQAIDKVQLQSPFAIFEHVQTALNW